MKFRPLIMFRASAQPVLLAVAALSLATAATVASAAPPPNRMLNDPTGEPNFGTQCNPVIRSAGDKVVAVWNDAISSSLSSGEQRMQYAVSVDSGATFTDFGTVPAPTTPVTWRWRNDAQLAFDPLTGAFWVAGQIEATATARMGVAVVRGTFSGSTLVWETPIVVRDFPDAAIRRFPILAFDFEPFMNELHLLYCNYYGAAGQVEHQKSSDGSTWTAPFVLSSGYDLGFVSSPRLAIGIQGEIHAAWLGQPTDALFPIRYRLLSFGVLWTGEQTAAEAALNPLVPGNQYSITGFGVMKRFTMEVNRIAGSNTYNRPAIAWAESWHYGDEPFTDLPLAPFVLESESNDVAANANSFVLGHVVRGASSKPSDLDFFKVSLAAGEAMLAWPDSVGSPNGDISIYILGPDGQTTHGTMITGSEAVAFRAPTAGLYFVRVAPFDNTTYYRVRTRASTIDFGEARDQRDIAVAYKLSGSWTSPRRLAYSPVGYDDHLPEMGWGVDGLDYLTWYDFGIHPSDARAHLVVARNHAGNDPIASGPQIVTTEPSRWDSTSWIRSLTTGHWNTVSFDGWRVHLGWTDLRTGNANVMATTLATSVVQGVCPAPASAAPGEVKPFQIGLTNQNLLFEEKASMTVTGSRSWPSMVVTDVVPPNTAGTLDFQVSVPDTAAPGVNTVSITVRRQSGIHVMVCSVPLTITATTGVDAASPLAFALDEPHPNPFYGSVSLAYALPSAGPVRLEIFGVRGERIRTLVDSAVPAGPGTLTWDGRDEQGRRLAAGLYFVRLAAGGRVATRRLIMMD